jgi:phosphate transport system permease protein
MTEIGGERIRSILKPLVELLAGVPSVVYGFFGLVVVVPIIQETFNLSSGATALAGAIMLGIISLPTIITLSDDAIRAVPREMREASLALGASKLQTIFKVVVPYALSGITSAAILGVGRAIGETMTVLMVTGNSAQMPTSMLDPVRTITATIALELGEAPKGGNHYQALFVLGCVVFLLTLVINLIAEYVASKKQVA